MNKAYKPTPGISSGSPGFCIPPTTVPPPLRLVSGHPRIVYRDEMVSECRFVDNLVGSEGHWYNSWFIANDVLTRAALNDLRNQASEVGADTVFIPGYVNPFRSSVTIIGQAFFCGRDSDEPDLS